MDKHFEYLYFFEVTLINNEINVSKINNKI